MKRIEGLELEEYLKYFDVGVKDYVVAACYDMSMSSLKNRKKEWGFGVAEGNKRRIETYKKWKSYGYIDKDICKLMGMEENSLYYFKKKNGLSGSRRKRPIKVKSLYY